MPAKPVVAEVARRLGLVPEEVEADVQALGIIVTDDLTAEDLLSLLGRAAWARETWLE